MAVLVLLALILAFTGGSDATWCVCRTDLPDNALQKTLDYACGAGADCSPILQNGPCYNPNTVKGHCSYAANSYFQRKGQAVGSCDFSGTATVTTTDPSYPGCSYPSTAGSAGTPATGTPTIGTPTTGTPTIGTPTTGTPTIGTPTTGTPTTGTPTTGTPTTGTPTTGTPTTGIPTTGSPTTFSPNGSGGLGGLGPSGTGISTDGSDGGILPDTGMGSLSLAIMLSCLVLFRG